jgi:hypothetical protein
VFFPKKKHKLRGKEKGKNHQNLGEKQTRFEVLKIRFDNFPSFFLTSNGEREYCWRNVDAAVYFNKLLLQFI